MPPSYQARSPVGRELIPELERALVPGVSEHQRLLIREHLAHIAYLD